METYLIWNPSLDEKSRALSFFVTAVNIQRIEKGSREMIEAMLRDSGIQNAQFHEWTVKRFLTNYLTDDPESEDWQDSWAETWEPVLQLSASVVLNANQFYPVRTWEHDHSWDGTTSIFPVECVVIGDFDSAKAIECAAQVLKKVAMLRNTPSVSLELNTAVPDASVVLFASIGRELARHQQSELTVRERAGYPLQLIISLGAVDEAFFESGAKLALLISELCEVLGGTTTYEEGRDKLSATGYVSL